MMRMWMVIVAVMVLALAPLQATAETSVAEMSRAAPVAYSAIPAPRPGRAAGILRKVQGYECRSCRRQCVRDFKIDCYEEEGWCRRQFVRCMRECWEDFCR